MGEYILSIDNGTQSIKAILFNYRGDLIYKSQIPIDPYYSTKPGFAEQDGEYFWKCLCMAISGLWDKGFSPEEIKGIGVTTQRATMLVIDREGRTIRPAVVWLDQRRSRYYPSLGIYSPIFRLLGIMGTIRYFQDKAIINWIYKNEPDVWKKIYKYVGLSGFLNFRLTGEFRDSVANQVGYLPFDYKRHTWAKGYDWKWKALALSKEQLPDLVKPSEQIGHVSHKAAEETGLRPGTIVFAAASDKACEVLGTGCIEMNEGCIGYGTTATINVTSKKYIEPVLFIPPYPAAVPNTYTIEIQNFRGYWLVSWFKKEFGEKEVRMANKVNKSPEELLNEMLDKASPGCLGLMALPYWTPGVKIPGPEAKGAIIGFGDVHSRAHVYRAILEGLAYALRDGKDTIEKRTSVPLKRIYVAGGGSQSDRIMQITSDIFGLPAYRPKVYETSGLGCAIDVAVGLGVYPDFNSAVKEMTGVSRIFEPDMKNYTLYSQLFERVYKKMYKRLRPLYEAIKDITGYPE